MERDLGVPNFVLDSEDVFAADLELLTWEHLNEQRYYSFLFLNPKLAIKALKRKSRTTKITQN